MTNKQYTVRPLIATGIPTFGKVSMAWCSMFKAIQYPLGCSAIDIPVVGKQIADARNEIVERALSHGARHLFFLGDDVHVPPNIILSLLERKVSMVTGIYWTKTYPTFPYIWREFMEAPYLDWKMGEFFRVDWAGVDAVLFDMQIFRDIEPPWFSTDWVYTEKQKIPHPLATEDFYFYLKAKKAGHELWCDSRMQCTHENQDTGVHFGLMEGMAQAEAEGGVYKSSLWRGEKSYDKVRKTKKKGEKFRVADLGCGMITKHFGHDAEVVRFDIREDTNPDVRSDLRNIPESSQSFDVVYSSHVVEHFPDFEMIKMLKEWCRILKIGGILEIEVPDISYSMKNIIEGKSTEVDYRVVYGQQGHSYDFHRTGYTVERLTELLSTIPGMSKDIEVEIAEVKDHNGDVFKNIIAQVKKTSHPKPIVLAEMWEDVNGISGDEDRLLIKDKVVEPSNGKISKSKRKKAKKLKSEVKA